MNSIKWLGILTYFDKNAKIKNYYLQRCTKTFMHYKNDLKTLSLPALWSHVNTYYFCQNGRYLSAKEISQMSKSLRRRVNRTNGGVDVKANSDSGTLSKSTTARRGNRPFPRALGGRTLVDKCFLLVRPGHWTTAVPPRTVGPSAGPSRHGPVARDDEPSPKVWVGRAGERLVGRVRYPDRRRGRVTSCFRDAVGVLRSFACGRRATCVHPGISVSGPLISSRFPPTAPEMTFVSPPRRLRPRRGGRPFKRRARPRTIIIRCAGGRRP